MKCSVPDYKPFKRTMASASDLATMFGVSRVTIWRWAKEGKIPQPIKISQKITRWKLADIPMLKEGE